MLWFNYVASFSDGLLKTGATPRPFHRLQTFVLEAERHGLRVNGFHVTKPSASRHTAMAVAIEVQQSGRVWTVDGHKSWFRPKHAPWLPRIPGGAEWVSEEFAGFVATVNYKWDLFNPTGHAEQVADYEELQKFASELGALGQPIKPSFAAAFGVSLTAHAQAERSRLETLLQHRKHLAIAHSLQHPPSQIQHASTEGASV